MNCLCSQQVALDQSTFEDIFWDVWEQVACTASFGLISLSEQKKNTVCIYSESAAGCRRINFVIGVENAVGEKKGCLILCHDMIERIALKLIFLMSVGYLKSQQNM